MGLVPSPPHMILDILLESAIFALMAVVVVMIMAFTIWIIGNLKISKEMEEIKLKRHTIDETPPAEKDLLMIIDINAEDRYCLWTVGTWSEKGWSCPFDEVGYDVLEWYELPPRKRINR